MLYVDRRILNKNRNISDVPSMDIQKYIHITDVESAKNARQKLIQLIWNAPTLPQEKNNISFIQKDTAYTIPFDIYKVKMPYQMDTKVRFFQQPENTCLALYHEGHLGHHIPPFYREDFFKKIIKNGCDLLWFNMPLMADNSKPKITHPQFGVIEPHGHEQLQFLTTKDFSYLRYFFEPILQMLNFSHTQKNYKNTFMIGHSGGGWTTHVYSAIDERIQTSYSHAGSLPLFLLNVKPAAAWGDFEQHYMPLLNIANYMDLYVLATTGERRQIQLLNKYDPCCFSGSASEIYIKDIQERSNVFDGEFQQIIHPTNISHDMHNDTKKYIIHDIKTEISK